MISNKNLKKIKFGILFGCLFYFIFASHVHFSLIDINNDKSDNKVKTSLDPTHDLTGTPIYIDNTDPLHDWATFQATYAWCTGDGSAFQPYTISQVLIDGPHTELITIKNSDVNFSITWCDLLNGDTGIYLDNVTNGEIQYNNCSGGSIGIYLDDCYDNLISNNNFQYISLGIYSYDSSYSEITRNNFIESNKGIYFIDSFSNIIDDNVFNALIEYGIKLDGSNQNYFAHNEISDACYGVYSSSSEHNTIYNNTIHDLTNWDSCGVLSSGDYNNISENNIERCNMAGIKVVDGNFNDILNNTIDTIKESGIIVESCSNFNVKSNVIMNVLEFGIELINSESGDAFNNLLYDCGFNVDGDPSLMSNLNLNVSNKVNNKPVYFYEGINGLNNGDFINAGQILLYSCDLGVFSNLNLDYCSMGIGLYYCESTSISDSDFTYNLHSGIFVKSSNYTIITNITASNNGKGIAIEICDDISITESNLSYNEVGVYGGNAENEYSIIYAGTKAKIEDNTIAYNNYSGIHVFGGDNFLIKDNLIERNRDHGIHLASQSNFNNISNNIARYNSYTGIFLDECSYNTISGNVFNYNTIGGIYLDVFSSNNTISDNTVSYNGDFGIKLVLTYQTHGNNITKNILTSNYDTTVSLDYSSSGILIFNGGRKDNFISENTIRNHIYSIEIRSSYNITLTKNELYDDLYLMSSTDINFTKNLLVGSTLDIKIIHILMTSNCTFIENELKFAGFSIKYVSNYNSFIGNVISDSEYAFAFFDSSYNKVINNSIYRASQCFLENGDCIENVFSGNYCEEGFFLPIEIWIAIISSIVVVGVGVFLAIFLKRRKSIHK